MKIAVCIKQVPDTTDVKIDPKTNTLVREGVASITNPFDEYAVEEALLIREKYGGEVHVISMGPPQAIEVLKNALAVGADKVYLVSDRAFAGADTLATAYTLSKTIQTIGGGGSCDLRKTGHRWRYGSSRARHCHPLGNSTTNLCFESQRDRPREEEDCGGTVVGEWKRGR